MYFSEHEFSKSVQSIKMSVAIFPNSQNYYILGYVLAYQGDYGGAYNAYTKGLTYQPYQPIYDQLAILSTRYGNPIQYEKLLQNRLLVTPSDYILWFYLAIMQYRQIDIPGAQKSITQALKYAPPSPTISAVYKSIMNETPLP
jgi:tetratricopeptide (TPR) repeat protein